MIQPYLLNSSWAYTSVDGLIWLNSGLKLPTNLEERACNAIIKIYNEVETGQPLIIDFRNIKDVSDRALDNLFYSFNEGTRELLLMNFDAIVDHIDKATHAKYKKTHTDFSFSGKQRCRVMNPLILQEMDYQDEVDQLRKRKITEFVKSSFVPFEEEKYLSSTPIKASGVFDASLLLSNHTAFYWICLELSDHLKMLLNSGKIIFNKEFRLLSVNMKSTPFASVVSLLNGIPLVTIDHLGPKHKVFDIDILDDLENLKQYSYIYLGDFCVGGTEIKIAKTYAGISNSDLNTAIVIGSFFDADIFQASFSLFPLVKIEGLHPKAKFSI